LLQARAQRVFDSWVSDQGDEMLYIVLVLLVAAGAFALGRKTASQPAPAVSAEEPPAESALQDAFVLGFQAHEAGLAILKIGETRLYLGAISEDKRGWRYETATWQFRGGSVGPCRPRVLGSHPPARRAGTGSAVRVKAPTQPGLEEPVWMSEAPPVPDWEEIQ
jgi:hypothetical protein